MQAVRTGLTSFALPPKMAASRPVMSEATDEARMVRFGLLMVQGMEVLKFPASKLKREPQLRILFCDAEQTALYSAKSKDAKDAKEFRFCDIAVVAPTPGHERTPRFTVTANSGSTLEIEVDTVKSRDIVVRLLSRLVEVSAPGLRDRLLLESYAEKRGGGARLALWTRKFFVLEGEPRPVVKAYDARISSRARVTDRIELAGLLSAIQSPNDDRTVLLRFNTLADTRAEGAEEDSEVALRFSSQELARSWVDALQRFVAAASPEDPAPGGAGAADRRCSLSTAELRPMSFAHDPFAEAGQSPASSAAVTGFLWKRAMKSGRNWRRRFFVLIEDRLMYYTSESSAQAGTEKGCLVLNRESVVAFSTDDKANSFLLTTGSADGVQRLYAKAEQEVDRTRWIAALRRNIAKLQTLDSTSASVVIVRPGGAGPPVATAQQLAKALSAGCKSGYLYKRAIVSGRNWKRRFFVLHGGWLLFYKDEYSLVKPRGLLHIADVSGNCATVSRIADVDGVKWVMSVAVKGKTLVAAGASEEETAGWMEEIRGHYIDGDAADAGSVAPAGTGAAAGRAASAASESASTSMTVATAIADEAVDYLDSSESDDDGPWTRAAAGPGAASQTAEMRQPHALIAALNLDSDELSRRQVSLHRQRVLAITPLVAAN